MKKKQYMRKPLFSVQFLQADSLFKCGAALGFISVLSNMMKSPSVHSEALHRAVSSSSAAMKASGSQ